MEKPVPLRQYNPQLPAHIEQAILIAMAKERTDRHSDISAFIVNLHEPIGPQLCNGKTKTKNQLLTFASECIEKGLYSDALAVYEQIIRLDPYDSTAYLGKAVLLLTQFKRYQEALNTLVQFLLIEPENGDAYFAKGLALSRLDRIHEALEAFQKALQYDPSNANLYIEEINKISTAMQKDYLLAPDKKFLAAVDYTDQGFKFLNQQQNEKALAAFEQATQSHPYFILAYIGKDLTNYRLNRYRHALAAYNQVIQLDANFSIAYHGKGDALFYLGRFSEALEAYTQAAYLDPKLADAFKGQGTALFKLNRFDEALITFERAIQLDPNYGDAQLGPLSFYLVSEESFRIIRDIYQSVFRSQVPANGME